ncbi:MAG: hypothetical protein SOZ45_06525 [Ruminococcus sp.]|nr:hypothetical protein [Ruminococcus sp.]
MFYVINPPFLGGKRSGNIGLCKINLSARIACRGTRLPFVLNKRPFVQNRWIFAG